MGGMDMNGVLKTWWQLIGPAGRVRNNRQCDLNHQALTELPRLNGGKVGPARDFFPLGLYVALCRLAINKTLAQELGLTRYLAEMSDKLESSAGIAMTTRTGEEAC